MTAKVPATQACIRRAIEAARKAGLRVRGIRADGTVLVDDGVGERKYLDERDEAPSKYAELGRD